MTSATTVYSVPSHCAQDNICINAYALTTDELELSPVMSIQHETYAAARGSP